MRRFVWMLALLLLIPLVSYSETLFVAPGNGTLTEALASCADGDVIELGDGVFCEPEETFPLIVDRQVTLRAAEGANPVIDAPAMKSAIRVEADGVTIEGLEIRFRRHGVYGIGNDMTILGCRLILADPDWRVSSCGIWCGGILRMTLRECAFTGCSVSMAGPPVTSANTENIPKLTAMFEVGEDPKYFTSHVMEDCTVNGKPLVYIVNQSEVTVPEGAGEIICCSCGEVTIRNADVSDDSMGMQLMYNRHVTVEDSRADRCGIFGIYIAKCNGGDVVRCTTEKTNHGIDIRADRDVTLLNCTAVSCEQGLFFSMVEDGRMIDCTVEDTRQGIFMAVGRGNIMSGCTVTGSENGIHLEKENDVQIVSCTVETSSVCGMRLDRSSVAVTGNTLRNNWVGIMGYGGMPLEITDNLFDSNDNCGIFLRNTGIVQVSGNRFQGSGEFSVLTEGIPEDSVVQEQQK